MWVCVCVCIHPSLLITLICVGQSVVTPEADEVKHVKSSQPASSLDAACGDVHNGFCMCVWIRWLLGSFVLLSMKRYLTAHVQKF